MNKGILWFLITTFLGFVLVFKQIDRIWKHLIEQIKLEYEVYEKLDERLKKLENKKKKNKEE